MPNPDLWCTPDGCYMCTTPHEAYWKMMQASWNSSQWAAHLTDEEIEADRGRPHP